MSINKKYEFTGETQEVAGRTLRRIRAVRSFGSVKAGDLGGWIEAEINLSHAGNCWVHDAACVYDNARVYDNAQVCGDANVYGNARVYYNAQVYGNARVYYNAQVCGSAHVYGNALVYGNAQVCGSAHVYGNALVYGNAQVCDTARVYGNAQVFGTAQVYCSAHVCGDANVYGSARIYGNAVCAIDPVVITGLRYTVTITDKHIQIGCQQYTPSQLRKWIPELNRKHSLTKREIRQLEFIISESRAHSRVATSTAKRKGTNK